VAGKLDTAGLVEEANQVGEMQGLLESGDASGEGLQKAAQDAHDLAAKLRLTLCRSWNPDSCGHGRPLRRWPHGGARPTVPSAV
jgi:hypothetical protein